MTRPTCTDGADVDSDVAGTNTTSRLSFVATSTSLSPNWVNDDALQKGRSAIDLHPAIPRYSQCDVVRLTEVETEGFGPFHHS